MARIELPDESVRNLIARVDRMAGRRNFLKTSGAAAGLIAFGAACSSDQDPVGPPDPDPDPPEPDDPDGPNFDLGEGDIAVLNYALLLEQLEFQLFDTILRESTPILSEAEGYFISEFRIHEFAHQEFLKLVIPALGGEAISTVEFDFSSVDLSDRATVLNTVRLAEDTGVTAYNGASPLIENPAVLEQGGKIVSVEARHASAIAQLIAPGTQEWGQPDVPNGNLELGLDGFRLPSEVFEVVGGFVVSDINADGLFSLEP